MPPYNGAGTYAAPASTWNPAVSNTAINSTDWIALLADVTTALSTCMLKDGQQTPTANIPMGGFKFTGLAAGSGTGNSLRYEQLFTTGAVNLLGPINEVKTTVVSSATPDIWTSIGNVVDYTGTVTATGFAAAPQAGARRVLICAAAAPFTAGANMLIDGYASGSTFTAAAGDTVDVIAVTTTQFRLKPRLTSGFPIVGTSVPRSYLSGLTMSTAGSSATMTIAAGQAVDSTNAAVMSLASSMGKTTSAWAVGSGNGGLDTGAIANTTWYHFYEIMRPDTGVVDVLFSLSASAPTMPTNYTLKRRIGSGKTDGAAQWVAFTQDGDYFRWSASVLDVNTTNPGVAAVSATLTVPTGVNVHAHIDVNLGDAAQSNGLYLSDLAATDETPSLSAAPLTQLSTANLATENVSWGGNIRTNTSAQIRYRVIASGASTTARIASLGWIDRRGRDS